MDTIIDLWFSPPALNVIDITVQELLEMMRKLGIEPTKAEFSQLWQQLDVDGDGELSFEEFLNGLKWLKKGIDLAEEIVEEEGDEEEESQTPMSPRKPTREEIEQKTTVLSKVRPGISCLLLLRLGLTLSIL